MVADPVQVPFPVIKVIQGTAVCPSCLGQLSGFVVEETVRIPVPVFSGKEQSRLIKGIGGSFPRHVAVAFRFFF